jgi:hypothetical protein
MVLPAMTMSPSVSIAIPIAPSTPPPGSTARMTRPPVPKSVSSEPLAVTRYTSTS